MFTSEINKRILGENDHPDNADDDDTKSMVSCQREMRSCAGTYKPARVNRTVKTICCLTVVRRRHRSGIGCQCVNSYRPLGRNTTVTYEYEDQQVETDVTCAATDKEVIDFNAMTINAFIQTIPCVMNRTTASLSLSSGTRDAESTYH